jgi:hypothetical protein
MIRVAPAMRKTNVGRYTKSLAGAGGASFTALSVHLGVFRTRLLPFYGRVGRPAEEAAPILTTLGSPGYPVVDGGYYDGLNLGKAAALVENPRARSRLAQLSAHLIESALH